MSTTEAPAPVKDGLTFLPVPTFTDVDVQFGAGLSAYFDRHKRPQVPAKYENMVSDLFFQGGRLTFRPDVDAAAAHRAVRAWLRSFTPAHEAKTTTVAYALWVWEAEYSPA